MNQIIDQESVLRIIRSLFGWFLKFVFNFFTDTRVEVSKVLTLWPFQLPKTLTCSNRKETLALTVEFINLMLFDVIANQNAYILKPFLSILMRWSLRTIQLYYATELLYIWSAKILVQLFQIALLQLHSILKIQRYCTFYPTSFYSTLQYIQHSGIL